MENWPWTEDFGVLNNKSKDVISVCESGKIGALVIVGFHFLVKKQNLKNGQRMHNEVKRCVKEKKAWIEGQRWLQKKKKREKEKKRVSERFDFNKKWKLMDRT